MEFVDLALHVPARSYAQIERFGKGRVLVVGSEDESGPLAGFWLRSSLAVAVTPQIEMHEILNIRNEMVRSRIWDPIDASDDELSSVRRIVLESAVEFASLTQEWRYYILSIGRENYVQDEKTGTSKE